MTQNIRFYTLAIIIALVLSACTISNNTPTITGDPPIQATPTVPPTPVPVMSMTVSYDTTISYNAVDQVVEYSYVIGSTSTTPLPGPATVTDDRVTVDTCPFFVTVGNLDTNLDAGETITCTGSYKITQLDLDAGSFTNTATASAGENFSSAVITTVTLVQTKALTLSTSANPETYNSVDEKVIYTYTVKNTGNVTLGPAQFSITDNKFDAPFICGSDGDSLAPNATATCSRTYTVTQADLNAGSVTNTATVTDGTTTSDPVTGIINKGGPGPGTSVQHVVKDGEWLWQIARCYGADPRAVVEEFKRQHPLKDPAKISPGMTVTVPNVGSQGFNSCVTLYTVQSGDTWESVATRYNVDSPLLQQANPGATLLPGSVLKVPVGTYP